MALFYFSPNPWFLLETPLCLSVSWHFLNIWVGALWIPPISQSVLTSRDFLLISSFYSSFLSSLGKYVFQTSFPSHCFLMELMNIYTLPLLAFHSHTYFSPLPQLHISWGKLDYSLHPIVIDRHSSSYPLKPVLIY